MTRPREAGTRAIGRAAVNAARGQLLLQDFLRELAIALVPRGVTARQFSKLATFAFADAAATFSQLRNGRVNQSRVAVLTGLRRAEVRKLLGSGISASLGTANQSTIETVLAGWCTDKHFVDARGAPKSLPVSKGIESFARLVERYGGDVPPRAVLDELCHLRIVTRVKDQVRIRSYSALIARSDFRSFKRAMPLLLHAVRLVSEQTSTTDGPSMHRLALPARSRVELQVIRERCASSVTSWLSGLRNSLSEGVSLPRPKNRPRHRYGLTVTVVEYPEYADHADSNPPARAPRTRTTGAW